ncbi:Mitochondrial intermediate peptidase [Chionoecetes opilio]|uniref:Mitochondrial intermediate peptidase n=1 Tax=Chionoecetes opilio TaxID=41210 RepID=A0A8J4Y9N8_CHIOP|nr:Mitochondrial intermediate peptidase [Chionoecetes opilio]
MKRIKCFLLFYSRVCFVIHSTRGCECFSVYLQQGLFGHPELQEPEGFYLMKENAIFESEDLVKECCSPNRSRKMVEVFDQLSDTLCRVADLAEFVRLAHPQARHAQAAEDACVAISGLVEKTLTWFCCDQGRPHASSPSSHTLGDALRITSMGQYRSDSSPQPWIRKKSRVLDVTLTRLRLGHTTLTAHLHHLRLSPDPHCPWCMNFPETIEHFLLQCPRFHSHRVVLHSQLLALNVTTFDLPTLLAAAGVPPSRQHAVIRLTCAFLRKTGQLPHL